MTLISSRHDPYLRRGRLYTSGSWRVFWAALGLIGVTLLVLIGRGELGGTVGLLIAGGSALPLIAVAPLSIAYLHQASRDRRGLKEDFLLLLTRLLLWLGTFWFAVLWVYLMLTWASSRGLLDWVFG